ncbi:MAG: 50S ribosomal protein L9 [Deltaproteobacteria bacterium]|nr:50S ribosomal protein L9 [Deltaproteobacteria bacterium]
MEVILQQDYPQLGFIGDRVNVKRGYARNFLVPRGIALETSSKSAKELNHRLTQINARKQKKKNEAEELAERLNEVTLEFKLRAGVGGKSYGSIQSKEIEVALRKLGYELERRQIKLGEPIKTAGEFKVSIKLHSEVSAECTLNVIAERVVEPKPVEDAPKKGGRRRKAKGAESGAEQTAPTTEEPTAGESVAEEPAAKE